MNIHFKMSLITCMLIISYLFSPFSYFPAFASFSPNPIEQNNIQFLYAIEGEGGSLKPQKDGYFLLTINKVSPYIVYFSDRPATIAGSKKLEKFIKEFKWSEKEPPNAAIVLRTNDEETDTLIVQIQKPNYNIKEKSFTALVKIIDQYNGNQLKFYAERNDKNLPETFDNGVELYIE